MSSGLNPTPEFDGRGDDSYEMCRAYVLPNLSSCFLMQVPCLRPKTSHYKTNPLSPLPPFPEEQNWQANKTRQKPQTNFFVVAFLVVGNLRSRRASSASALLRRRPSPKDRVRSSTVRRSPSSTTNDRVHHQRIKVDLRRPPPTIASVLRPFVTRSSRVLITILRQFFTRSCRRSSVSWLSSTTNTEPTVEMTNPKEIGICFHEVSNPIYCKLEYHHNDTVIMEFRMNSNLRRALRIKSFYQRYLMKLKRHIRIVDPDKTAKNIRFRVLIWLKSFGVISFSCFHIAVQKSLNPFCKSIDQIYNYVVEQ
ncbi:hypothetical protein RHMOL_Rhmol12G0158000 [Rhododendron molle]|uniref:Uncharacterized protein n=1 Tax=Rhododendron molle TaxID=49168 RepID=A0ACC0LJ01_RHOML|nr:hypothetical protein RHMOL_Rhmol12G0158000 [Rhododendron molle]